MSEWSEELVKKLMDNQIKNYQKDGPELRYAIDRSYLFEVGRQYEKYFPTHYYRGIPIKYYEGYQCINLMYFR